MKTIRFFAVMMTVVALMAGCGNNAKQGSKSPTKGKLIGISFQHMNNPFFVELAEGARKVVEAHGDTLVVLDAQSSSLKQKNDLSDLIMQKPAAVMINPVNWEGIKGTLIEAKRANVPVIVVDAPVKDQSLVTCTVASDNVKAGELIAEELARTTRPAKIVVLALSINKACIDRVEGFKKVIAKYPDMKIIDQQECKGTIESSRPVMRDLIGRYPDINVVFAINDPSALGCISALESAGKLKNVKIVAVDGAKEAVAAIRKGKMLATSAQFPKEIGRIAAEKIYESLAGKTIEKDIKVRVELVTINNIEKFAK
ncbi:MAG: sugar ABC transporter substrate-binding protein [Armatimonadetes bacterium]|nr:sugar ABC transporter substrate-binding protein [Armatimonadota bacterium]